MCSITSAQGLLSVYNADSSTSTPKGQQSLTLVAPNGGEEFSAGDTATIRWTGVDSTDFVRLEYSLDSGVTWQTIVDRTNGLEYVWTVPHDSSSHCIMRVSQAGIDSTPLILSRPLEQHDPGLEPMACIVRFSPDGRLVLTSDAYTTIRIWDAITGEMRDSLRVYDGSSIFSMDISRDGQWFVLGRTYGGEIRNMNGKLTGSFAPNELVENVEFSNDGKWLAVSILGQYYEYNEIRVYDVQSWQVVWSNRKYDPQSLTEYWSIRFTPDDSRIVVADKTGAARVFDAGTGVSYGAYYDASGIAMASYSTNGKRIVVGNGNGYAVVVDAATGSVINSIRVAAEGVPVDVAAFVPGGDNVFCIPRLGSAGIWETSSGALLRTFSPDIGGWSADFSPDGTSVVMGGGYVASIWNLETAQRDISDSVWSIVDPEPTDPEPTNPISLQPVYANSANETVALEYEVTVRGQTQLYLTDVLGGRVATLVDDVVLPGRYVVQWNAAEQASGMFFCVLQTPTERVVKPLMIKR